MKLIIAYKNYNNAQNAYTYVENAKTSVILHQQVNCSHTTCYEDNV